MVTTPILLMFYQNKMICIFNAKNEHKYAKIY